MIVPSAQGCGLPIKFCRSTSGAAAAEFALLLPIILMFVFALYEFGRVYWIQNTLQFAAEETARWAMATNPACTTAGLQTHFNGELTALSSANVTWITPTQPTTTSSAPVTATYCLIKATYSVGVGKLFLFSGASFTLVGQSQYVCPASPHSCGS